MPQYPSARAALADLRKTLEAQRDSFAQWALQYDRRLAQRSDGEFRSQAELARMAASRRATVAQSQEWIYALDELLNASPDAEALNKAADSRTTSPHGTAENGVGMVNSDQSFSETPEASR